MPQDGPARDLQRRLYDRARPAKTLKPSQWFRRKALKHPSRVRPRISRKCQTTCAAAAASPSQSHAPRAGASSRAVSRIKNHDGGHIPAAQCDGRGFHADFQVVITVHHGVFGVVGQHPKQVAQQHAPGEKWHLALHGRKRHRNAKTEGHAQHRLRHGNMALGIRVEERHRQSGKGPLDGGPVGGQHQRKCTQRQHRPHPQRLFCADAPARHRPVGRALDVLVKITVSHVVHATACTAHEDGAQGEHHHQMPARKAVGRHPQGCQRRPQQQEPARRPVPADQVQIQLEFVGHG